MEATLSNAMASLLLIAGVFGIFALLVGFFAAITELGE